MGPEQFLGVNFSTLRQEFCDYSDALCYFEVSHFGWWEQKLFCCFWMTKGFFSLLFLGGRQVILYPGIVSSYTCANQYSAEDLKETLSKSLVLTLCSSLISSILPWEVQLPWRPRSIFSTQEDHYALSRLSFLVLWSENHLQTVSWGSCRALLF